MSKEPKYFEVVDATKELPDVSIENDFEKYSKDIVCIDKSGILHKAFYDFKENEWVTPSGQDVIDNIVSWLRPCEEYASQSKDEKIQIGEWQLCPKCYGEGIVPTSGTSVTKQCDVCNGNKIIQKPIINQPNT